MGDRDDGAAPSPAALFDAFGRAGNGWARPRFHRGFRLVAAPGQAPSEPLRPGDVLIRRIPEDGYLHVAFVAADDVLSLAQALDAGWRVESRRPGGYVIVVEAGARPHRRADAFARRVLDPFGRVPPGQLVVRPADGSGEAVDESDGEDVGGPAEDITDWPSASEDDRMLYVMERLVGQYGFPVNGAAGLVGNLSAESGVIPSRIEGSKTATPMRAPAFGGGTRDFTADEVMNRNPSTRQGPRLPGIGLAQWTSRARRAGLFQHVYQGRPAGSGILSDMDAQIDYLVTELQGSYAPVYQLLTRAGVTADDAADVVVYRFEVPGSILQDGKRLPRTDRRVQAVFATRRGRARRALRAYRAAHPATGALQTPTGAKDLVDAYPTVPHGESQIRALFGEPGNPDCVAGRVNLPAPLPLSWNMEDTVRRFACHRLVAAPMQAAFNEVYSAGLWDLLHDFGGCYALRKKRGLKTYSVHSWGIAVDVDVARNPLGSVPKMDPRIVAIFKRHRFEWGGGWSRPDGMHFQYATGV